MNVPHVLCRLGRILLAYRRRDEIVRPLPIRLWVESASNCNLRCPMCPNKDMPAGEKQRMPIERFRTIVDQARHFAHDLYLHHRGEPFLNPDLFAMIRYARAAGLRTRFHTNGALMDETRAAALIDAGPNLVSFSVDGFDKENYESIRVGANFETTVENILRLAAMRRRRGARRPYLVVEKIRFRQPKNPEDPSHVAALRRRFIEAGVDEVIEKAEYVWAEAEAPEPDCPRTSTICTFPWYAMVICANGDVTPCPQDFWAAMVMGNVDQTPLREIWNSAAYQALRHGFRTDIESLPLCRKCDRLHRKTVGGIPLQYAVTFLADQIVGYGRLRRRLGTAERNG